ncbi:MAG: hypothetical protein PVI86_01240 [Phycisphaerae bacterium]|jgi:hypothetical protein
MSKLWPSYVNPALQLTRLERKEVHREAWKIWAANRWNMVVYLMLPTLYLAGVFFASDVGGWLASLIGVDGRAYKLFRAFGPALLAALCFVGGGVILQRYRFAPCVYRALRKKGHDVCLKCGYWLRGLPDNAPRCPECGRKTDR